MKQTKERELEEILKCYWLSWEEAQDKHKLKNAILFWHERHIEKVLFEVGQADDPLDKAVELKLKAHAKLNPTKEEEK